MTEDDGLKTQHGRSMKEDCTQNNHPEKWDGKPYDVGGGEPPVTAEEIYKMVDDVMNEWRLIGRQYVRMNFWHIPMPWSMRGVLETITANPKKWLPLHKIVNRLEGGSRFDFWRVVFENYYRIPQDELLRVWYDCLNDRGSLSYQRVTTDDGFEEFEARVMDPEMQKASVITNPLLIDNPIVNYRYCQVEKPGWKMLQYIHGRRHHVQTLPPSMDEAIKEDCLPVFAMYFDMASRNVSFSLLMRVLRHGAVEIFRYLMTNRMVSDEVISLPELCCFLAVWFQDSISVPMLTVLEELHPGLIRSVKDEFGRNLLWYAVQNLKTGWFHPDCKLTPFLLASGCDPQNANQIGLTWQAVTDGLTKELKTQMMRRRYSRECFSAPKPYLLQINQPLSRLSNAV